MSKILNCAVVGLGRIGYHFHIPQILKNPNFKLIAVVDPLQSRVDEVISEFGVESGYTNCNDLSCRNDIDLVIIASPTRFHREQTELFLSSNMDVFCDKPVALSSEDAISMDKVAKKFNRKLMVYQPHRLWTKIAKKIVESGKLGRIFRVERKVMNFVRRNDWQAILAQGGGMLLNYGAHYIDSLLYLTEEEELSKLSCQLFKILSTGDAEDVVIAQFLGKSNISYSLEINMASALANSEFVIYGEYGSAKMLSNNKWEIRYVNFNESPAITLIDSLAAQNRKYVNDSLNFIEETISLKEDELEEYYSLCYDYFALNKAPFVPMEETIRLMTILEKCRADSKSN